jgi:1-acyl-sn-glycerol-3-phosphate acyltransferase
MLRERGPLLLACNHPNSFLDGMILTTLFDHKIFSLARGDAFKNKQADRMLRKLQLLPVYRTSEGVENLEHNYTTFEACQRSFEKGEIVLIFSEGRCENEWHLRPLKKGTARLATAAWKNRIPLKVIPVALNYSSFKNFGKEVHINFGDFIDGNKVLNEITEGRQLLAFNQQLSSQLENLVYEISAGDQAKRKKIFSIKKTSSLYLLLLPALAGWILHAPLFYPVKLFTHLRFRKSGHYDSVLTSVLLILYPIYWVLALIIALGFGWKFALIAAIFLPFSAWACVQVKYQLEL